MEFSYEYDTAATFSFTPCVMKTEYIKMKCKFFTVCFLQKQKSQVTS